MCGLVGVFGQYVSHTDQEFFQDGLISSQLRGQDSTGMTLIHGNKYDVVTLKAAMDATAFLAREDIRGVFKKTHSVRVAMGHTRFATHGKVIDKNAHPFTHEHIVLAHNGGVWNKDDLPDGKKFDVDSEAICHSVAKIGAIETLRIVNGAFALSYYDYDQMRFNLIRNHGRRLYIAKHKNKKAWYYASEGEMLFWLLRRNDIDYEPIQDVPESTLYSYDLESNELTTSKVNYEKKPVVVDYRAGKGNWHFPHAQEGQKRTAITGPSVPQSSLLETRNKWRGSKGPHGDGADYLRQWGLNLGDTIMICMPDIETIGKHTDNAKGMGYFKEGVLQDADIWIYGFTERHYKSIKRTDDRFFTKIVACWFDVNEGSYQIHTNGIFESPPGDGKVTLPRDLYNVFKKSPMCPIDTKKKDDDTIPFEVNVTPDSTDEANEVVLTQEALMGLAEKAAEDHAALMESFSRQPGVDDEEPPEPQADTLVQGPQGSKITYARWLEDTKQGCGYCTHPICSPDNVIWIGNSPIHANCQDDWDECERKSRRSH